MLLLVKEFEDFRDLCLMAGFIVLFRVADEPEFFDDSLYKFLMDEVEPID